MNDNDNRTLVGNYMGALAHLLSGRPGRHGEFINKVELVLSGLEPHAMLLMQFSETVRATGRPVLWIHHSPDVPQIPQIGLVALIGGQLQFMENCMLWMSRSDDRASLIPDNFQMGAYRFDDNLSLYHTPKTPARSFQAAQPAMTRAYRKLYKIEGEQLKRGDSFKLPELRKAA